MTKISIPMVNYTCPTCGSYAQVVGTEAMKCPACDAFVCPKCSQKSFCGNCLSFLTPEENASFQSLKVKNGAAIFSTFCGIVGGGCFFLVGFISILGEKWIQMGVCIAGFLISILIWYLFNRKNKNDTKKYQDDLQSFANIIRAKRTQMSAQVQYDQYGQYSPIEQR